MIEIAERRSGLSGAGVEVFAGYFFATLPPGLAFTERGDAHSAHDYRRWLTKAGYGPTHVHELDDPPQTIALAER